MGETRDRLIALAEALPEGAAVHLDAAALLRLAGVEASEPTESAHQPIADLTCEEAGEELGRAASTIRTWCGRGAIPGAYRLHGREWRIPRASLRRYLDQQAEGKREAGRDGEPVDLGSWRKHYKGGQG